MKPRRIALIALTGVALAAAGGGAVAATTKNDPEDAVLQDAAKRLNVSPKALKDALSAAENAQIDKAVQQGRLTQQQADRLKAMRAARGGHVLGFGHGAGGPGMWRFRHGPGGPGHFDHGGPGHAIAAAAGALGLTQQQLFDQLRSGKSLADITKAQGKNLADVKAAVRKAIAADLDQAVKDKRITQAQADRILQVFDQRFDTFAQRSRPFPPGPRGFHERRGP